MLPSGFIFLQRDWLSSNSLLLKHRDSAYLFDSGYVSHAPQLAQLIDHRLAGQTLDVLINTHLHSDHCGGNALLQSIYPHLDTWVPATQHDVVNEWAEDRLSYQLTGQLCPRFHATGAVAAGNELQIHGLTWAAFASKGHDNDSLIYFQPEHRLLLSADALWEDGFSVVFPEFLDGSGFEAVSHTYDLIEQLNPTLVIPGHGGMFTNVHLALAKSRQRLDYFQSNPISHANYAAKVLIKFKLMELQSCRWDDFFLWCQASPLLNTIHQRFFITEALDAWVSHLFSSLAHKKALHISNGVVFND